MNSADTEHYRCTACGGHFRVKDDFGPGRNGDVTEGMLECCSCGLQHPVVNGMPRFVPAENYAGSFGYQWNIHRETQLDSYTGLPISRQRLFSVCQWPDNLEGQRVLEAGSGAGRFTEVLLQTGAEVFSFDYSNAVEANLSNNGEQPNLHLFQGDIFNIPFAEESSDYRIIEFAFGKVPSYLKATATGRKILSKKLARGLLPTEFDLHRKQGFSIPLVSWLRGREWKDYFREVLMESKDSLFDRRFVADLLAGQELGRYNSERLFGLMLFELWRREYRVTV